MISTRPGSRGFQALALLVAEPGVLDAEALGLALEPPVPLTLPVASHAERSRAYTAWADRELGALVGVKRAGGRRDQATARASRLLSELQRLGLVETRGGPTLMDGWARLVKRHGELGALQLAHPLWPRAVPGLTSHLAMVREVGKGPPSVLVLLGAKPSGARKETYRELCAWGVVVPPRFRWPTEAGRALVEGRTQDDARGAA